MYIQPLKSCNLQFSKTNKKQTRQKNITFASKTSAGSQLRKLGDISCAYLGKKMISGSFMNKLEPALDATLNVSSAIKILEKYKENMLDVERKMFEKFKQFSSQAPSALFTDYLKTVEEDCLTRLKLEELFVLDDIDVLARDLSPKTALSLRKKTTKCRDIILKNDKENTFKRKTLINSLDEITPISGEEKLLEDIKGKAAFLPTSSSSENAFAIKYLNRSHSEIAKRLLRASIQTVEHVVPDSLGGANDMSNFILTSSYANSYRSNMPLVKYLEIFPQIPQNCQKYIDDIIGKMNKGKLRRKEMYPYDIKRTLENESKGKISLDLSKYQYSEAEAQKRQTQKSVYLTK